VTAVASLPPEGPEGDLIGIVLASLFVLLYAVIIPGLVRAAYGNFARRYR
jgi:hypothetical protein